MWIQACECASELLSLGLPWVSPFSPAICIDRNVHARRQTHHSHKSLNEMKVSRAKKGMWKIENNHKKDACGSPLITLPNTASWLMCTRRSGARACLCGRRSRRRTHDQRRAHTHTHTCVCTSVVLCSLFHCVCCSVYHPDANETAPVPYPLMMMFFVGVSQQLSLTFQT